MSGTGLSGRQFERRDLFGTCYDVRFTTRWFGKQRFAAHREAPRPQARRGFRSAVLNVGGHSTPPGAPLFAAMMSTRWRG